MLINESASYLPFLKGITQWIKENQVFYLLEGRQGTIDFWIKSLVEERKVGPQSIEIFRRDLNRIMDALNLI